LSFGGLGNSLCVSRLGVLLASGYEEDSLLSFPLLVPGRRSGYILVLNLVSLGDFGLIFYLCSLGIQDRLSSECFGAHR
jgi:hypothetical protein